MEISRQWQKPTEPATNSHVFIFDKERILRFQGRIDDVEKPTEKPTSFDTVMQLKNYCRIKK
jgi:hypothetical protein